MTIIPIYQNRQPKYDDDLNQIETKLFIYRYRYRVGIAIGSEALLVWIPIRLFVKVPFRGIDGDDAAHMTIAAVA